MKRLIYCLVAFIAASVMTSCLQPPIYDLPLPEDFKVNASLSVFIL